MPHPLLYEINTRCWLTALSDRQGRPVTLMNVPPTEFARWRHLGLTHIWLMGVWSVGPRSRAIALASESLRQACGGDDNCLSGSPYSIADYSVAESLGGETGLQTFRQRLHDHGLKLILDFVPNHVGLDHPWLNRRPDLFVHGPPETPGTFRQETVAGVRWLAHGRDPNFPGWTDTAQLDYRLARTQSAMLETLLSVAGRCDGVRCDMAMLVLKEIFARTWRQYPVAAGSPGVVDAEFWAAAIGAVRRGHPDFLFLAEVYWGLETRLRALGFDYTYDKELYDELVRRHPAGVQRRLLDAAPGSIEAGAHFLENHDEARIASLLSLAEHRAAALLILSLPGMRLLHEGQLEGAGVRIPVQVSRRPVEPRRPEVEELYERLLTALRSTAIGQGEAVLLKPREAWPGNPTGENFALVQWQDATRAFDLAVVNLAPHRSQCHAPVTARGLGAHVWLMKDLLGEEQHVKRGSELLQHGLFLDLPAHGAQLFHLQPID